MKCFNHCDKDAVTLCKACAKALCHECLENIGFGFACKDEKCISRAKMLNTMIENNSKVMNTANKQIKSAGFSGLFIGIGFIVFGIISYYQMPSNFLPFFLGTTGLLLILFGASRLGKRHLYPETNKER
jgi:hypothetical protein